MRSLLRIILIGGGLYGLVYLYGSRPYLALTLFCLTLLAGIFYVLYTIAKRNLDSQVAYLNRIQRLRGEKNPEWATAMFDFQQGAVRFLATEAHPASFVPFEAINFPTYLDLDRPQGQWYRYWRAEFNKGNPLPTDLTYIFLYLYELINQVDVPNAAEGYRRLNRVWQTYRANFPQLNNSLPTWLVDYAAVYEVKTDNPLAVYEAMTWPLGRPPIPPALLLHPWVGRPLAQLPARVWQLLSDYKLEKSTLYQMGQEEVADELHRRIFSALDRHLRRSGQPFWERHRPSHPVIIQRTPFLNALYPNSQKIEIFALPYDSQSEAREWVTNVFKHTENSLRQRLNQRARLKVKALDEAAMALIEAEVAATTLPEATSAVAEYDLSPPPNTQKLTSKAAPIPPRPAITLPNVPAHNLLNTLVQQSFFRSAHVPFAKQAELLAKHVEPAVPPEPCSDEERLYRYLNLAQLRWYFYWRSEVRRGNYLPTSAAYVFIHALELIHGVGTAGTADTLRQLQALIAHYATTNPLLELHLVSWLLSWAQLHQQPILPLLEQLPAHSFVFERLADWRYLPYRHGESPLPWSFGFIAPLLDYDLAKSQFLTSENRLLLEQAIPAVFTAVNTHYHQRTRQTLLTAHPTRLGGTFTVENCYQPPNNRWSVVIAVPELPRYTESQPLRKVVTQVVKAIENELRAAKGFRGRLQISLPDDLLAVVRQSMAAQREMLFPPPPKPQVQIDLARTKQLLKETNQVFQLLNLAADPDPEPEPEPQPAAPANGRTPHLEGLDDEWQAFAAQLTAAHVAVLTAVLDQQLTDTLLRHIASQHNIMPALLLDSLNELAQDSIGDIVLELTPTPQLVDESYRAPLQTICQHFS
ncbi:MAG: TerB N-terminal domain-containing protein [Chloroflexi bacterium]|nr:TerB N-terminal domain-containing protein [Chloroflexota bacterium]